MTLGCGSPRLPWQNQGPDESMLSRLSRLLRPKPSQVGGGGPDGDSGEDVCRTCEVQLASGNELQKVFAHGSTSTPIGKRRGCISWCRERSES
jgi:hypothetical protein